MPAHFSHTALKFLRGLARHNDREWFEPRKPIYETELKAPMLAVIDEVNQAMLDFAPEHVRPPQKIMMRIYRDIRFSNDKRPYKTHVSAWWARQGLEKTSGGGFYLELSATGLRVAAGVYMPQKDQMLAIRRMLLDRHEEYRALLKATRMTPIDAMTMTRGPKGFPANHPGMDLVIQRQWGVFSELPVETAVGPSLVKEIAKHFRLAAPLVMLLNGPLTNPENTPRKPLF
jgi:uncharacterized protein (TIGR02453 family)